MRVSRRVAKIRRTVDVDTQQLRKKTVRMLEDIFKIAADYARGKVGRVTDEDGNVRELTIPERQFWARIAAYTAQIINTIARGIDERQIDQDLDKLEVMLHKGTPKNEAEQPGEEASGKLSS